jgi:hypothetical protein
MFQQGSTIRGAFDWFGRRRSAQWQRVPLAILTFLVRRYGFILRSLHSTQFLVRENDTAGAGEGGLRHPPHASTGGKQLESSPSSSVVTFQNTLSQRVSPTVGLNMAKMMHK